MFGKKKEDEWEFIGAENYFDENENSRILTEEEKQEIIKTEDDKTKDRVTKEPSNEVSRNNGRMASDLEIL